MKICHNEDAVVMNYLNVDAVVVKNYLTGCAVVVKTTIMKVLL